MGRFDPKINFIAVGILSIVLCLGGAVPALGTESGVRVTYRLKWLFNMSTLGDLYADRNQMFTKRGLRVTVKAGGPERDAIKELELGYAQFGVASADQVIRARAKGASVVVLAQLFQINPLQWIYRADKIKLERLADLKGKTLGITYGGNDETIMRTLLAKGNISESEVKLFSVRYDYTPFYRHKADIWPVYRNTQAVFIGEKLRQAGEQVAFFNPAHFGVKFVANSVVTSERMLKEHPQTVRKFMDGLLSGWREALEPPHAQKALECLRQFDKDTAQNILEAQLRITRDLIKPEPHTKIGTIDVAGWEMTEQIMLDQKQIQKPIGIKKALRSLPGLLKE
ncbi:MAG: ABC transporter substrate-binding protein [Desulfobacterales bacterium]